MMLSKLTNEHTFLISIFSSRAARNLEILFGYVI